MQASGSYHIKRIWIYCKSKEWKGLGFVKECIWDLSTLELRPSEYVEKSSLREFCLKFEWRSIYIKHWNWKYEIWKSEKFLEINFDNSEIAKIRRLNNPAITSKQSRVANEKQVLNSFEI